MSYLVSDFFHLAKVFGMNPYCFMSQQFIFCLNFVKRLEFHGGYTVYLLIPFSVNGCWSVSLFNVTNKTAMNIQNDK